MAPGFGLAVALAFAFAVTNGLHDASNAIATRAARPLHAVLFAGAFNMLGLFRRSRASSRPRRARQSSC